MSTGRSGPGQLLERGVVAAEVTLLGGPVDQGPAHDAVAVDQERPAQRRPAGLLEDPISLRGRAVWPEVAEHGKEVALGIGPGPLGEHVVARDRKNLDVVTGEGPEVVADLAQLSGADAGECEREENDDDVLGTPKARQGHRLAVLVFEREVGSDLTDAKPSGNGDGLVDVGHDPSLAAVSGEHSWGRPDGCRSSPERRWYLPKHAAPQ